MPSSGRIREPAFLGANPAPPIGALAGLGAFLAAPVHWRILGDLLGIAVSGGVFILPLYVLLQAATPRQRRAQAIAANNVVNAAAMVGAATAMIALGAAGVGSAGIFLLTGLGTIAVAALFQCILPSLAAILPRRGAAEAVQR
jgi:acyl-[acyl-carrier-protein]-phospholipid O-acyltransferase / long-chain-fatty-acid--[acyl-carrier-protein] ligase